MKYFGWIYLVDINHATLPPRTSVVICINKEDVEIILVGKKMYWSFYITTATWKLPKKPSTLDCHLC